MNTRVSVLTCSFNQARWLRGNLQSVRQQTHPDIEHIVADGGSTDGSVAVLEQASKIDGRLRWWSRPDSGQASALDAAFQASTGEIIAWLNSDDAFFDAKAVERVVRLFSSKPEIDVIYGQTMMVNENDVVLQHLWVPPFHRALFNRVGFLHQPSVFMRREALTRNGFVDPAFDFAMDGELWHRLDRSGCRMHRCNAILAVDRHQRDRKSENVDARARAEFRAIEAEYDLPRGPLPDLLARVYRLTSRLLGLPQLLASRRQPNFVQRSGLWVEMRQQLLMRRRSMPMATTRIE